MSERKIERDPNQQPLPFNPSPLKNPNEINNIFSQQNLINYKIESQPATPKIKSQDEDKDDAWSDLGYKPRK